MVIPSPGAVCPAIVMPVERLMRSTSLSIIQPDTLNTTVMGSLGYCFTAQRKEPVIGFSASSSSVVTVTTIPPLPPEANFPKPSAEGNAGVACQALGKS